MREDGTLEKIIEGQEPDSARVRTDLTREEWDAMADSKLQELLQTSHGALLLACIRESKDRIGGKPAQSIAMTVKEDRMDKMPIDDLVWLATQRKLIDVTPEK